MRRKFSILFFVASLLVVSCAGHRVTVSETKHFPEVRIPSVYTDQEERIGYLLDHYWDDFSGVPMDEIEIALSNFLGILDNVPLSEAQKALTRMFDRICEEERADTSAHYYTQMTRMVSKYLFDPNSPLRNEDYYLPFVRLMAESPLTSEDMRAAYRYEAESCAICQCGTMAPDFKMRTAAGRTLNLYDVNAEYIMLFFSNPGCGACKEIIEEVMGVPEMVSLINSGAVAVVNVYIDEDLVAWREYEPNYPESWISCYDIFRTIRNERLYDVRAIPSLYLLDADKTVLLKDAPTQKVINRILNQIP